MNICTCGSPAWLTSNTSEDDNIYFYLQKDYGLKSGITIIFYLPNTFFTENPPPPEAGTDAFVKVGD